MSLAAFQRALVDITLRPETARALRLGDLSKLSGYELTTLERERLLAVVEQAGFSVNCSLSRGNRLEMIFQTFPMCCVLLRPVLRALVDELWAESHPSNYQLNGEDLAFAALLGRKVQEGTLTVRYAEEVLAYELACLDLARRARSGETGTPEAVLPFQYSPEALLPPLSRMQPPPVDLPVAPCLARIRLQDGRYEVNLV